jgi:putative DNA methylase
VKAEIGDLYPLIPDPAFRRKRKPVKDIFDNDEVPSGYLVPVAYLWTRTVTCKRPDCKASVPLVKQTWLCKKKGRYVALKSIAAVKQKRVRFEVHEAAVASQISFDPDQGSEGGGTTCPFCNTVADADYVQAQGVAKRVGSQLLAVVCRRLGVKGKTYLTENDLPKEAVPNADAIRKRIEALCRETGLSVPNEPISPIRPSPNARGLSGVTRHGFTSFGELFSPRQLLVLLEFAKWIRAIGNECGDSERGAVVSTYCGVTMDKVLNRFSTFSIWDTSRETVVLAFGKHMLPMVWDYAEAVALEDGSGGWLTGLEDVVDTIGVVGALPRAGHCMRGSATDLPASVPQFDAIITDPPYYDNIPYADISDYYYVWLKRSLGTFHAEHFASQLTPKKSEATALSSRHSGNVNKAKAEYESMMLQSFQQAATRLKPGAPMVIVYAHKTTLGWATLVDALRRAGFTVSEAWPLDTEYGGHLKAGTASLSSSIFLVSHKRAEDRTGSYEETVHPALRAIVGERVETLWEQGISGADLVIACVGAGLRAFTRFARVEYANGEEVPAERFLTEVETVVLDSVLGRLSKDAGGNGGTTSLAGVDPATRFYTLWRYTYRSNELDAGEAIVFANGTHVELDGLHGLSSGSLALVEKKKGKYRLFDFTERGEDDALGIPTDKGQPAPLIDALHRTLWLMEHRPRRIGEFLREAEPNREQMRLVAQALAGPALKGGELGDVSPSSELGALSKLTANWHSVVEDNVLTPNEQADRKRGQKRMFEE